MNELALTDTITPDYYRPSALMDPTRFQHLSVVARVMSDSSLMPETLRGKDKNEAYANAFMVVNIADRWGIDPFLAAQAMSVVYGRLMCEGKLVAAVLDKTLGITLNYDHTFNNKNEIVGIIVSGPRRKDGKIVSIEGTIEAWKTTNKEGKVLKQWTLPAAATQLIYRGTREWCRVYEPGALLGIITDDEYEPSYNAPLNITPQTEQVSGQDVIARLRASKEAGKVEDGFNADRINDTATQAKPVSEEKSISSEPSSAAGDVTASPAINSQKPDAETSSSASGEVETPNSSQASTSTNSSDEGMEWVFNVTCMLWAATKGNRDTEVLKNQRKAASVGFPKPGTATDYHTKKLSAVFDRCFQVVDGSMEAPETLKLISGMVGRTEAEIEATAFKGAK